MLVHRLLLAAGLVLAPAAAMGKAGCASINPELYVPGNLTATMSVIQRPETCSLVVSFMDTSILQEPIALAIDPEVNAAHGEVSVADGFLRYRRTAHVESEALTLQLSRADGPKLGVILVIRMPSREVGS